MQNSDFWTRITSLYGSQTWPVILCIYHSVISTRITRLYGSQPSSVVFACKTATFGPEYKSLRVPDLTCCFVYAKQRDLHKNDKSIWVPALICVFFSCKTASLWPDLQVCMGSRPHLWFLHANQQLLDQNCMSLWVLELTCDFLHAKHSA